jgi:hypothetical protein
MTLERKGSPLKYYFLLAYVSCRGKKSLMKHFPFSFRIAMIRKRKDIKRDHSLDMSKGDSKYTKQRKRDRLHRCIGASVHGASSWRQNINSILKGGGRFYVAMNVLSDSHMHPPPII